LSHQGIHLDLCRHKGPKTAERPPEAAPLPVRGQVFTGRDDHIANPPLNTVANYDHFVSSQATAAVAWLVNRNLWSPLEQSVAIPWFVESLWYFHDVLAVIDVR
jgi:hypothetical protein